MGLIPIIVLKLAEILQIFPEMWSRLEELLGGSTGRDYLPLSCAVLEGDFVLEKRDNESPFRGEV